MPSIADQLRPGGLLAQEILQAALDAACGGVGALTFSQAQNALAELAAGSLEITRRDSNVLTAALMPGSRQPLKTYDQGTLHYLVVLLQESQKEAFVQQYLQAKESEQT